MLLNPLGAQDGPQDTYLAPRPLVPESPRQYKPVSKGCLQAWE